MEQYIQDDEPTLCGGSQKPTGRPPGAGPGKWVCNGNASQGEWVWDGTIVTLTDQNDVAE